MHLSGMTETAHAIPGLEAVLTTSERAAHRSAATMSGRDRLEIGTYGAINTTRTTRA